MKTNPALREASVTVGTHLARQVFERRGNHVEVHLKEAELAALLAVAVERYAEAWNIPAPGSV